MQLCCKQNTAIAIIFQSHSNHSHVDILSKFLPLPEIVLILHACTAPLSCEGLSGGTELKWRDKSPQHGREKPGGVQSVLQNCFDSLELYRERRYRGGGISCVKSSVHFFLKFAFPPFLPLSPQECKFQHTHRTFDPISNLTLVQLPTVLWLSWRNLCLNLELHLGREHERGATRFVPPPPPPQFACRPLFRVLLRAAAAAVFPRL